MPGRYVARMAASDADVEAAQEELMEHVPFRKGEPAGQE